MQRKDDQETESILTDQCKSTCKPVESRNEFNHNSNKENSVTTGSAFANLHQRKPKPVKSVVPKNRIDLLKWNGWGYKDSQFVVKDGIIHFTGDRYPIGELSLPYFTQFVMDVFKVDLSKRNVPQPLPAPEDFPRPAVAPEFAAGLRGLGISHSVDGVDRLVHAHGHTLRDVFTLRQGRFERIPDVVAWPGCHEEVVALVRLAHEHNVVVIPFGGGTSVSGAVSCPAGERRTILSLDTSQMNRVLWLDGENLLACCEAGIIGQDLERELQSQGFTVGHEPDSYEFSSLGGWVATRASGMKKNLYGNIEDLLVHARTVTPAGVLEKACLAPRVSCGPDLHHLVLGSEGTLGVITEVMLKIRPLPACKKYGSVVFPDFESGVRCLREVARKRCQPASVRLMDNEQFRFGQSLRPVPGCLGHLLDGVKKLYLTRVKRFDPDTMCVATLLFEGEPHQVAQQETLIYALASQFGGIPAGEKNGERGYVMTFIIAYIRDLGLEYNIVAESFETSVCWDRTLSLCENVKHRLAKECKALGVKHYLVSCRVTQTYDSGCCVYFYFALRWTPEHADPLGLYERLEESAREEVLASGGSLSHHHGVGKLRARWFPGQVSAPGVEALLAAKRRLDPRDILACGNLLGSKL